MSPQEHNIFSVNSKTSETHPGLFLTIYTLKRFVGTTDGGWLNDIILQQVVDLLNFPGEYCSARKRGGFHVPGVIFGDTYADSHKINPKDKQVGYDHINTDVPESITQATEKLWKIFNTK